MNFPLLVARRYLFARRSTNAINIITGISVLGVAIGTAALILVLSVFNGFEDLLASFFGHFNPDVKITATKGKTFSADSAKLAQIRALPGVAFASETLEEIAFFRYGESQDFGALKGVDQWFPRVNDIDSTIMQGEFNLGDTARSYAVLGAGMQHKLSVNINNPLEALAVYMPDQAAGALDRPFKTRSVEPIGVFSIQQEFDNQYILSNIGFVREILGTEAHTVSALEVRCKPGYSYAAVKKDLAAIMGEGFTLRDEYEQNEAFFKVMRLEKWMGFAITSLMLLLMAFNTVGALWMIVLDKQKDISILKSMGARDNAIRRIFLLEGMLLTALGLLIGIALGMVLYFGQKYFDWVKIPPGFLVDSYPIAMRAVDFIPVVSVVLFIGLLASLLPARRAVRTPAFLREE